MTGDDFFNLEEENSDLISRCEEAYDGGTLDEMRFSEEEFEYLINHFVNEMDDDLVFILTRMGYEQHPYSTDLTIRYSDVLIVNGELERAEDILSNRIAADSSNSDIHFLMSRLYIKKEEFDNAHGYLENAMSLSGGEGILDMLLTAAQDFIDCSSYENSLKLLYRAQKESPDNPEIINDLAFCYERLGDFDKSLVYYQKYLDLDPFNDNVWFNVGTIYARELKVPLATEAFDYAIALNPQNSSVLFNKAILLLNSDMHEEGIATFKEFLLLEPGNVTALLAMGESYLTRDELSKALDIYTEVILHDPSNIDAHTGLSYVFMRTRDYYMARTSLRVVMGNVFADYSLISDSLKESFYATNDPEFLTYYIISLYYLKRFDIFYHYIEELVYYDKLWLVKLVEMVPSIKKDKLVTGHIKKKGKKYN
ncbi:MAG: tetratricopeptide repeat protein [Bacteroidia bacterium]|nr:tetratricopeptide repeat protein [Bacteroidia bacterium]